MKLNYKFIFYSRVLLFLAAFTGVYLEITKHGGFGMLLYYTVLSNLLVTIFTGYLLRVMSRSGENWQSPTLLRLKGGVTMSIMITCVIYHFMLAPIATDFYRVENFLCHYIVPLWFLADTLFFDKRGQYKIWDPVLWTILPLVQYSEFQGQSLPLFLFKCEQGLGRGHQMVFDHFCSVYGFRLHLLSDQANQAKIVFLLGKLGRSL